MEKNPILVTGSHRSGSTWVGKMLSLSPKVSYIHEPFNPGYPPNAHTFKYWFQYVRNDDPESGKYKQFIDHILHFKYPFLTSLKYAKSIDDFKMIIKRNLQFLSYRNKTTPLLKDPIALFSAEWLSKTFNTQNVIVIRHPAAFAGSLKRKNWKFPFSHFLKQEALMTNYLKPFRDEIKFHTLKEQDIIEQASLLWKIFHHVILTYKKNYPNWIFLKHEDLSKDPVKRFEELYGQLDIRFSSKLSHKILEYSGQTNQVSPEKGRELLRRDSESNIMSWKARLNSKEIKQIRQNVEEISSQFYEPNEW